jgi:hypothetical protein
MPQFVVLTHDHPFPHWDLLLEAGDVLRTWRLLDSPDTAGPVRAEALADHRREYLTYEGPVSGGRGHVARWDSGGFTLVEEAPDRLELQLSGQRLRGRASLAWGGDAQWTLLLVSD